jgi:hypothetical protein
MQTFTSSPHPALPVRTAAPTERALIWFMRLWPLATLFHQVAWPGRHTGVAMYVLTLAALVVLLRPPSVRLFLGFLLLQVGIIVLQLPDVSNHWLFTGFVSATILLSWAALALRRRSLDVDSGELFAAFAPSVRLMLIILYAFAVLHKLNHDFLTPGVSCATDLMARIAYTLPGLPMGDWSDYLAIYGTLAIETAIPLLLIGRRTRLHGVLLGMAFHLLLVFDARWVFYDFSSVMYALYFLFVYDIVLQSVDSLRAAGVVSWLHPPRRERVLAACRTMLIVMIVAVLLGFLYETVTGHDAGDHPRALWALRHIPRLPFLVYAALGFGLLVLTWPYVRAVVRASPGIPLRPSHAGALILVLLALNGLAPYLGLKTDTAFSMFSNLSTEGGRTNHLFMPVIYFAGYQNDLVRIVESSDPTLQGWADRAELITYYELRRRAARRPAHSLVYERSGQTHALIEIADDPELLASASLLQRKMLKFRRIPSADGRSPCRH